MPGLKHMPANRLSIASLVLSVVVMMVVCGVHTPPSSANVATFVIWIAGALALIGIWVAVAFELLRRYAGGSSNSSGER